eukprot:414574-Rhodomonas_salina.1
MDVKTWRAERVSEDEAILGRAVCHGAPPWGARSFSTIAVASFCPHACSVQRACAAASTPI